MTEIPVLAVKTGDLLQNFVQATGCLWMEWSSTGLSDVDASLVTGETAREPVGEGAQLHSGTLNLSGALTLRAVAGGGEFHSSPR